MPGGSVCVCRPATGCSSSAPRQGPLVLARPALKCWGATCLPAETGIEEQQANSAATAGGHLVRRAEGRVRMPPAAGAGAGGEAGQGVIVGEGGTEPGGRGDMVDTRRDPAGRVEGRRRQGDGLHMGLGAGPDGPLIHVPPPVCVCVCARARACAYVCACKCVRVRAHVRAGERACAHVRACGGRLRCWGDLTGCGAGGI